MTVKDRLTSINRLTQDNYQSNVQSQEEIELRY